MENQALGKENYFDHEADIGVIGHGENIESCFCDAAHAMFALMADVEQIRPITILNFEFEEEDLELAFVTWLNILITKCQEHHLVFSVFRLHRDGKLWKGTVAGEPWRPGIERGIEVKAATLTQLSVKKIDHLWESRCIIDVS